MAGNQEDVESETERKVGWSQPEEPEKKRRKDRVRQSDPERKFLESKGWVSLSLCILSLEAGEAAHELCPPLHPTPHPWKTVLVRPGLNAPQCVCLSKP